MTTTTENRDFTKAQRQAIDLLARGGARYGTRIAVMKELQAMGLCDSHKNQYGRWVWRPTAKGWEVITELEARKA